LVETLVVVGGGLVVVVGGGVVVVVVGGIVAVVVGGIDMVVVVGTDVVVVGVVVGGWLEVGGLVVVVDIADLEQPMPATSRDNSAIAITANLKNLHIMAYSINGLI
jgi:hypothetical protein